MTAEPPIVKLTNQVIYYPGVDSYGVGTVNFPHWNDKEAWGTIGSEGQERPVISHNITLDSNGLLVSADWEVVEERRGG